MVIARVRKRQSILNFSVVLDSGLPMARRRKNRTHLKGASANVQTKENAPKSFVIKHGQVGSSLAQLVRDLRKVMEPNTATRLKVRAVPHILWV
jgi:hypothetical protein